MTEAEDVHICESCGSTEGATAILQLALFHVKLKEVRKEVEAAYERSCEAAKSDKERDLSKILFVAVSEILDDIEEVFE